MQEIQLVKSSFFQQKPLNPYEHHQFSLFIHENRDAKFNLMKCRKQGRKTNFGRTIFVLEDALQNTYLT